MTLDTNLEGVYGIVSDAVLRLRVINAVFGLLCVTVMCSLLSYECLSYSILILFFLFLTSSQILPIFLFNFLFLFLFLSFKTRSNKQTPQKQKSRQTDKKPVQQQQNTRGKQSQKLSEYHGLILCCQLLLGTGLPWSMVCRLSDTVSVSALTAIPGLVLPPPRFFPSVNLLYEIYCLE